MLEYYLDKKTSDNLKKNLKIDYALNSIIYNEEKKIYELTLTINIYYKNTLLHYEIITLNTDILAKEAIINNKTHYPIEAFKDIVKNIDLEKVKKNKVMWFKNI